MIVTFVVASASRLLLLTLTLDLLSEALYLIFKLVTEKGTEIEYSVVLLLNPGLKDPSLTDKLSKLLLLLLSSFLLTLIVYVFVFPAGAVTVTFILLPP